MWEWHWFSILCAEPSFLVVSVVWVFNFTLTFIWVNLFSWTIYLLIRIWAEYIEMGKAKNWKSSSASPLSDLKFVLHNPCRGVWGDSWVEKMEHSILGLKWGNWDCHHSMTHQLDIHLKAFFCPVTLVQLGYLTDESERFIIHFPLTSFKKKRGHP